jgi:hypothetical protein
MSAKQPMANHSPGSSPRRGNPRRKGIGIDPPGSGPWRPPTRRAFVAMLGAAAAALATPRVQLPGDREPSNEARSPTSHAGTTRWIGHC